MAVVWTVLETKYDLKGSKGDKQITNIDWKAYDGEVVMLGSVSCPEPSGSFIDYSNVTLNNCVDWVKAVLGSDEVKHIEDTITAKVEAEKTPITGKGVPWE